VTGPGIQEVIVPAAHGGAIEVRAGEYLAMPDIEADRGACDIVAFDMEPGDCLVLHGLTVHGAPGNTHLARRRRALPVIWLGDGAVFAARPGPVRPRFEGPHPSRSARFTDPGFRVSI
jgi:ectoine hydroxylase-related dioxygenase (phytanoyl-CoA dioxygenase family)